MKSTLFLLLTLASCSGKQQDVDILDRGKFMDVYVALATTDPTDSSQSDVAAAVLRKQGVTEEKFRATVEYYNRHPESWKEILDSVMHRMESVSAGKKQAAPN